MPTLPTMPQSRRTRQSWRASGAQFPPIGVTPVELIHICYGGPDRWLSVSGKIMCFEDHPYCGPIVLTPKTGEIAQNQPPEKHVFWSHVNAWYAQGKQVLKVGGKTWCKYETPLMLKRKADRAALPTME